MKQPFLQRDLKEISKDEISDALERIIADPEKKNAVVSDEKKQVAYAKRLDKLPMEDPVAIGGPSGNPFLGQQISSQKNYSMATVDVVDAEVRKLEEKAHSRAKQMITTHIDILHKLAQLHIEKETVGEEFMSLFIDGKAELYVA
ncbi:hypothetical protein ACH5RR_035312 [Cinchona calisaya]|uniref:Peptidase M41 domain-containing protein n=1 Tax=Cinchona calisaya TaxID=153742 RepID=A0ABD2YES6_9GENT